MLNEFRQDLVSGEWVLFATGRAQRPDLTSKSRTKVKTIPKNKCPFEEPEKNGNIVLATYWNKDRSDWEIKAMENKYPAILGDGTTEMKQAGPFNVQKGYGRHEVVVFRDHERNLSDFSSEEIATVFQVYQERYLSTLDHGSRKYTLIFHNFGLGAGASIQHPHSQIMSIPVLPPDVKRSLNGSESFYKEHKKRIYDVMIDWEKQEGKRILYENQYFIAFCPFVSKTPYEVRIFPRESHAHFEKMPVDQLAYLGEIMSWTLKKISLALHGPDYNFFIHTAPLEGSTIDPHEFYTWHIEISPKISMIGAFELGSGIDVNVVNPDEAAELLRNAG